jgi:D-aminopeptidase
MRLLPAPNGATETTIPQARTQGARSVRGLSYLLHKASVIAMLRPHPRTLRFLLVVSLGVAAIVGRVELHGQSGRPRAREVGVPFDGTPGPLNAITDVAGVEVGHATIIQGDGPLVVGKGPIRTGVTAIWPQGKRWQPVFAGWFAGNGFGEMTGAPWVVEGGLLGGPVMITGTYSVGVVRDAVNSWFQEVARREIPWHQPVVGETSDAFLNDGLGQHVTKAHVFQALDAARGGAVAEGNVGGGTGMVAHGFKGGI